MFTPSRTPTDLPTGIPKEVTDALVTYRKACELHERSWNAEGLGDRDQQEARAADDALIMEALANGDDIERIGRPHEAAFISKRDAYRTARAISGQQAAQNGFEVAAILGEHSDAIVEAFAQQAQQAAEAYRQAATELAATRATLERASNRLQWATAIDGVRVPSIADEAHPRALFMRSGNFTTERLLEVLEADAEQLSRAAVTERVKRLDVERQRVEAEARNAQRIAQIAADSQERRAARRAG